MSFWRGNMLSAVPVPDMTHTAGDTFHTDWVNVADLPAWQHSRTEAYRVWVKFDGLIWWQRHEWKNRDGSTTMGDWIRGVQSPPSAHYRRAGA
jgi:hypothetical protein